MSGRSNRKLSFAYVQDFKYSRGETPLDRSIGIIIEEFMKKLYLIGIVSLLLGGVLFFLADSSYHHSISQDNTVERVEILEGDDIYAITKKLKTQKFIGSEYAFIFGVWRDGLKGTFQAGVYDLSHSLSPADIAFVFSRGEAKSRDIKITFPEGWTAEEMARRLIANGLPGEEFLVIAKHPTEEIRASFNFLRSIPEGGSLEGYLFPDTYFFLPEATGLEIVEKLLQTFDKNTNTLREEAGEDFSQKVIMASILEGEVRTREDRRVVSGIFWKRINEEMAIQSDATLDYILQSGKIQHNGTDLKTDSPYNTYLYKGLPPGPVSNPSLDALDAAVHPISSEYYYFLSDPQTGETYFAKDFEEHKRNKVKVGL